MQQKPWREMTEDERAAYQQRLREDNELISAHHTDARVSQVFVCERCDRAARFVSTNPGATLAHFRNVHGVDASQATKAGAPIHTDAKAWFSYLTTFELDGAPLFLHSQKQRRQGGML